MAARKQWGGGTDGGPGGHQPLGITYTATQNLTLFNHTTPYQLNLFVVALCPAADLRRRFTFIDLYVFTR